MGNAPYMYDYINACTSTMSPSTVHVKNTGLHRYFMRYLLQKAISVFKWTLPDNWAANYFLYTLYPVGNIAVINTDKFGVIPQQCGLSGHDVFYRPTNAMISNPLLRGITNPVIGKQCSLIQLQPDYGGIIDLVSYYADMLALCAESAGINLINTRVANVFPAKDKAAAEAFKKMVDKILSGDPAAFPDKSLFADDGSPAWQPFSANVAQQYIVSDVLSDMRKIQCMFDTDIGIPNANTDKRERLISDEVNSNNTETATRCEMWLQTLRKGIAQTNDMFGLSISVDWRIKPENLDVSRETKGGETK